MQVNQSVPISANQVPLLSVDWGLVIDKSITFANVAGQGAIGTVPIFAITGMAIGRLIPVVTTSLVGATATIALGTAGNSGGLVAATPVAQFAAGDIIRGTTGDVEVVATSNLTPFLITKSIIATIATANLTAGVVRFLLAYYPLTADFTIS